MLSHHFVYNFCTFFSSYLFTILNYKKNCGFQLQINKIIFRKSSNLHFYHETQMLKWDKTGVSNVAGELALLAGLAMWVTTFPRIRRKMFELFFYTHYLYILFIVFFIFHVGISYSCMMLPGFYLFVVDRFLRFLQSRQGIRLVSARVLPCEVMELNFSKTRGNQNN